MFIYEGATEGRICFAATAPTDMQPKNTKRTPVIFYVTTWQKDGVQNEVSVKQGYAMKANAVATVTIGGQNFALAADDDKVYARDPADERKLLAAMSAGGPMTIKATSAKGQRPPTNIRSMGFCWPSRSCRKPARSEEPKQTVATQKRRLRRRNAHHRHGRA